jgi:hypothetical protein
MAPMRYKQLMAGKWASTSLVYTFQILSIGLIIMLLELPASTRDIAFIGCFGVMAMYALRRFATAWLVGLAAIPVICLGTSMFEESKASWSRLVLCGFILILLIRKAPGMQWKVMFKSVGILGFCLFVVANVFSALRIMSLESVFRSMVYCEAIMVYILTYYIVRSKTSSLERVYKAMLIGGAVFGAIGIIEFISQDSIIHLLNLQIMGMEDPSIYFMDNRYGLGGRISATVLQPVYAAIGFVIYAFIAAFYVVIYKPKIRWSLLLIICLGGFLTIATASRGPMLAVLPALFGLLILYRRKSITMILIITIILLMVGLSAISILPNMQNYLIESLDETNPTSANVVGRIELTRTLLDIFKANLLLGNGPGIIQKAGREGVGEYAGLAGLENQYAVILADGGIIAGFMYLIFMLGAFITLARIYRNNRSKELRVGSICMMVIFIYYIFVTATATTLGGPMIQILMACYGAIVAAHDNSERDNVNQVAALGY